MSTQDKAKAMKNQPENSKEQAPLNRFHLPIPQHVAQQDTPMDAREARAPKPDVAPESFHDENLILRAKYAKQ